LYAHVVGDEQVIRFRDFNQSKTKHSSPVAFILDKGKMRNEWRDGRFLAGKEPDMPTERQKALAHVRLDHCVVCNCTDRSKALAFFVLPENNLG
jgi:hypothetical protein